MAAIRETAAPFFPFPEGREPFAIRRSPIRRWREGGLQFRSPSSGAPPTRGASHGTMDLCVIHNTPEFTVFGFSSGMGLLWRSLPRCSFDAEILALRFCLEAAMRPPPLVSPGRHWNLIRARPPAPGERAMSFPTLGPIDRHFSLPLELRNSSRLPPAPPQYTAHPFARPLRSPAISLLSAGTAAETEALLDAPSHTPAAFRPRDFRTPPWYGPTLVSVDVNEHANATLSPRAHRRACDHVPTAGPNVTSHYRRMNPGRCDRRGHSDAAPPHPSCGPDRTTPHTAIPDADTGKYALHVIRRPPRATGCATRVRAK